MTHPDKPQQAILRTKRIRLASFFSSFRPRQETISAIATSMEEMRNMSTSSLEELPAERVGMIVEVVQREEPKTIARCAQISQRMQEHIHLSGKLLRNTLFFKAEKSWKYSVRESAISKEGVPSGMMAALQHKA